jgi:23S rRNA (uracil1939-C5)-methyltransferase
VTPGGAGPEGEREIELDIERLAAGGDGVGRDARGRVVFVPGTAPGDRVRVRPTEERKSFARGEVVALLREGSSRVEPRCPVFGACGGCAWQHLSAAAQLAAKEAILRDAFARIARLVPPEPVAMRACPSPFGWRARARVLVRGGRVGFRRRRSNDLCETAHCPVLVPALDAALAGLARDPPAADGEWELAAGDDGRVRVVPLEPQVPSGAPRVALRAPGSAAPVVVSAGVFFQANALLRTGLAEDVLAAAGAGTRALELFAGAGLLSVGLAGRFRELLAVEADAAAARDLRANLRRAGHGHARVARARAERVLERGVAPAPDVVVLDPPRAGLAPGAAARLAETGAPRIVYLSCDPATLARDARALVAGGMRLARLAGYDLFPQTAHVEALAVFERTHGGAGRP